MAATTVAKTYRQANQMNDMNPYDAPNTTAEFDLPLMRTVAIKLSQARQDPPSVLRVLTTWPGVPLLFLFGIIGALALWALTATPGAILTTHWPFGLACCVLGAILRDIGYARRAARIWPVQTEFIDWDKVDRFAQGQP